VRDKAKGDVRRMRPGRGWGFALIVLSGLVGGLLWAVVAGGTQPYESYEEAVSVDGPAAQFRFDDASGSSTIADSAGSYTATNSKIVLGGEGPFGGSRSGSFGSEGYASLPSSPLAGTGAFTAEGWVYWTGGSSYEQPVFDFGASATKYMFLTPASSLSGHKMLFEIRTSASSDVQVTATKLAANKWEYVAVTETGSGTLTLYVNGEQVGQSTGAALFPSSVGSVANDYLGKSVITSDPSFGGSLSNVAFYGKALSVARIAAHYDAGEYPVDTEAPPVSGTAKDGNMLTAKPGSWTGLTPISYGYQWMLCNATGGACTSIHEATEMKYMLGHEDVGRTLRVDVTGTNSAGGSTAASAQTAVVAALAPSNTGLPVISGSAEQGQLLSVSNGTWAGTPPFVYTYKWDACNGAGEKCKAITGATASSYRVLGSQIGGTLNAVVTAENEVGGKGAASEPTAVVTTGPPANTGLPAISGKAEDGHALSASTGEWAGTEPITYTYQWKLCNNTGEGCSSISGATSLTYGLGPSDVGDTLRVLVTAKNSVGSTGATSQPSPIVAAIPPSNTAAPTISGTARDGQTLTAGTGAWNGSTPLSYDYQWEECNSAGTGCKGIPGAADSSYTLGHEDVGKTVRVAVSAENEGGHASAASSPTAVVSAESPSNIEAPKVSGEARDGQTLSVSTGGWEGTPPLTYSYRWEACNSSGSGCEDIPGATGSSYAIGHGDVGGTVRVTVTAANGASPSASSASPPTTVVAPEPPSDTEAPAISGEAKVGETLTANTGSWEGTPPLSYGYQWQRCSTGVGSFGTGDGQFNHPGGVAIDSAGDLWVLDQENDRIEEFDNKGEYLNRFGSYGSGDGQFNGPDALTIDSHNDIWVVDTFNSRVEEFNDKGEYLSRFGVKGEGEGELDAPEGIAVEPDGDVWVSDTYAGRVEEFNEKGTYLRSAGSHGSGVGQVGEPEGLAIDSSGDVFVTDWSNDRVEEFNEKGEYIQEFGSEGEGDGELSRPDAIAIDSKGNVWVGDTGNDRIDEFSEHGSYLEKFGSSGSRPGQLDIGYPVGVAIDSEGSIWITDSDNDRLEEFNGTGEYLGQTFCANIPDATGQTYAPTTSDIGSNLRVVVTASNAGGEATADSPLSPIVEAPPAEEPVSVLAPTITGTTTQGQTLTASTGTWTGAEPISYTYQWEDCNENGEECANIFGATGESYTLGTGDVGVTVRVVVTAENLAGSASVTSSPSGPVIAIAPSNIAPPYISGTPQVDQTLTANPGYWEGSEPISYSYQWWRCGTGALGREGTGDREFEHPGAVAIDSAGDLWVVDTNNDRVEEFDEEGGFLRQFGSKGSGYGQFEKPDGIAIDPSGDVLVLDSRHDRVEKFSREGTYLSQFSLEMPDKGPISIAEGIAIDEHGDIWVSDTGAGHLVEFESDGKYLKTAGSAGSGPGQLGEPEGVAIDEHGNVWVADWGNDRVEEFSESGEYVKEFGSEGEGDGQLSRPFGIAVDAHDDIWVGDVDNSRLDKFSSSGEFLGKFGSQGTGPGEFEFQYPIGLATSPAGDIWVTDSDNNRMEEFSAEGAYLGHSSCEDIDGATGETYEPMSQDIGSQLGVTVTATNSGGATSATGEAAPIVTAAPPNEPPVLVFAPRTTGITTDGQTLAANTGTWSGDEPISYTYQWELCDGGSGCTNISGATASTYTLNSGDIGRTLRVVVTASNTYGSASGESEATEVIKPLALSSSSPPSISGTTTDGQTLAANAGTWTGSEPISYSYQWRSCNGHGEECADIVSAIGPEYTLGAGDVGTTIRVMVTAKNVAGTASVASEATSVVAPLSPSNSVRPSISGLAQYDSTVSASTGTWAGTPTLTYAYQWRRCSESGAECANIAEATSASYLLGHEDVGKTVEVVVTATNAEGSTSADSTPTAVIAPITPPSNTTPPAISGEYVDGYTLGAGSGAWAGTPPLTYAYQWQRCNEEGEECANITGATGSGYVLGSGDIGATFRVSVTASNVEGSASATSSVSAVIAPATPPSNTSLPSVSGLDFDEQALTANSGTWSGSAPMSYTYQWQRCNAGPTGGEGSGLGELHQPAGIATDSSGDIWVADAGNSRIEEFDGAGAYMRYVGARGSQRSEYQFEQPNDVALDSEGDVWVADLAHGQLVKLNAVGEEMSRFYISGHYPYWVASNEHGDIWTEAVYGDEVFIQEYTDNGEYLRNIEAEVPGQGEIGRVQGMAVHDGDIWLVDESHSNVDEFDEEGHFIKQIGSRGAGAGQFTYPHGIAVDSAGDVWVGDGNDHRVQEFGENGEYMGQIDLEMAGAEGVVGLATTPAGNILVLDQKGGIYEFTKEGQYVENEACMDIPGATNGSYTLTPEDATKTVQVKVTAQNAGGEALATSPRSSVVSALTLPRNVSPPTVSGTPEQGHTLTAGEGEWRWGSAPQAENYRWQRCDSNGSECKDIPYGLNPTYTLGAEDIGKRIRVLVTVENPEGTATAASSPTTVIAPGAKPTNTRLPEISGEARQGDALSVSPGTWTGISPISYAYQWQRCNSSGQSCLPIDGVTGTEYEPEDGDPGSTLRVVVTASNTGGSAEASSAASAAIQAGAPIEREGPKLSGVPAPGQTLSVSAGTWAGTPPMSYAYEWQRCTPEAMGVPLEEGEVTWGTCTTIGGAAGPAYTVGEEDLGDGLRAIVSVTNTEGSAKTATTTSAQVQSGPPTERSAPSISGITEAGWTLHAGDGEWSLGDATYGYQWESCDPAGAECAPIEGATGQAYELSEGDAGTTLEVRVTATGADGSTQASSSASAVVQAEAPRERSAPSVTGTPDAGEALHASPGEWTGANTHIYYQWESCDPAGAECAPIEGATGEEYELDEGDVSDTLRVRVGVHDALDSLTDVSAATPTIGAYAALANTVPPVVSGTPATGRELSVEPGSWSPESGLAYTYQWQDCDLFGDECRQIEGATAETYTPGSGDVGDSLRVEVGASDGTHTRSQVAGATQPVAAASAPAILETPAISGPPIAGRKLSATGGSWSSEGPLDDGYQWERCSAGGCVPIDGATASLYEPTEEDVNATLRVLVTASDQADGSTTAVSPPTATIEPEAIVEHSGPTISGGAQVGAEVSADPGIWSGVELTYAYQWQSCSTGGSDCAPIGGADEPGYLIGSGDSGTTLRVAVTVTGPKGSQTVVSAPTTVLPSGEASVEDAVRTAQETDPSLLAPSTSTTLAGQDVAPALSDGEEGLSSTGTLTSSTVSKETPGEFAVNTSEGMLSLAPVEFSPGATRLPTLVNGTAAFYANTWPATDTIVRPDALGATTLLQLRSAQAPTSFSWEVHLGADQQLKQLSDGAIAVVDATEVPPEAGEAESEADVEVKEAASGGEPEGPEQPGSEEEVESEEPEEEETGQEEVSLENPPAAPTLSTELAEAIPSQPQPQETAAQDAADESALTAAESETAHDALMVVEPPTVTDADGHSVTAMLTDTGDTITLHISPTPETVYPVIADPSVAAPTDTASSARAAKYSYGISDQDPVDFEHSGAAPEKFSTLDPHLKSGPLHVDTARLVIRYDVLTNNALAAQEQQEVNKGEKEITEREQLVRWLEDVKREKGANGKPLEPYITFETVKCKWEETCDADPPPTPQQYEAAIKPVVESLATGDGQNGLPAVKVKNWGAINEPDYGGSATKGLKKGNKISPLREHAPLAAELWKTAQSVVHQYCGGCKVIAGEFQEDNGISHENYIKTYKNEIVKLTRGCTTNRCKPAVWGLHDYHDVVHETQHAAHEFKDHIVTQQLGYPYIWISEAGVELQNDETATELDNPKKSRAINREDQRKAAFGFLHLHNAARHIERLYYYGYRQPPERARAEGKKPNPHLFDSGLVEAEHESNVKFKTEAEAKHEESHGEARPAYCVLVYRASDCGPTVETGPSITAIGGGVDNGRGGVCIDPTAYVTLKATIDPNGSDTAYYFEFGGNLTATRYAGNGSEPQTVSIEAQAITSSPPGGGNCLSIPFRVVASNADGTAVGDYSELGFETVIG
jgi:sugar lactone lactonase YvrE